MAVEPPEERQGLRERQRARWAGPLCNSGGRIEPATFGLCFGRILRIISTESQYPCGFLRVRRVRCGCSDRKFDRKFSAAGRGRFVARWRLRRSIPTPRSAGTCGGRTRASAAGLVRAPARSRRPPREAEGPAWQRKGPPPPGDAAPPRGAGPVGRDPRRVTPRHTPPGARRSDLPGAGRGMFRARQVRARLFGLHRGRLPLGPRRPPAQGLRRQTRRIDHLPGHPDMARPLRPRDRRRRRAQARPQDGQQDRRADARHLRAPPSTATACLSPGSSAGASPTTRRAFDFSRPRRSTCSSPPPPPASTATPAAPPCRRSSGRGAPWRTTRTPRSTSPRR